MFSSLPGVSREAAAPLCWAVSLPSPARASCPPPKTALIDRSHAVSPVNLVVERRTTGKMRLLAGFGRFRCLDLLGPVHSSGGTVRTVPMLSSASMRFCRGLELLLGICCVRTNCSFGGAWTLLIIYRSSHQAIWQKKAEKAARSFDGASSTALHCNKKPRASQRPSSQRYVVAAIRRRTTKKS